MTTVTVKIDKGLYIFLIPIPISLITTILLTPYFSEFWDFLLILVFLVPILLWAFLLEKVIGYKSYRVLTAEFGEEAVTLTWKKKRKVIPYTEIREVGKITVIDRIHDGGYYRVTVKTKGRRYRFFSGEDSHKSLKFEQTELSKFYYEFKRHGVKCC